MRMGLFISETWGPGSAVSEVRARARRAEELGFVSGWVPYLPWSLDALSAVQAAGDSTSTLELGTAVIPTYLFHPLALARQAATVGAAIGRPLHLGIGCSNEAVIAMHGLAYDRPAKHVREYLEVLVPALTAGANPSGEREASGRVQFEGEFFRVQSIYGAPGTSLPGSVLVGALGPHMLRAAGRFADGTIATWSNPTVIEQVIAPALREAAAAAKRPAPRIAAVVPVIITDDVERARLCARENFGIYESLPRYQRMMKLGNAAHVEEVCVIGNEAAVAERLSAYAEAGTTDFLAAPLAFGESTWEYTAERLAGIVI